MGANGALRITTHWTYTNSVNNKSFIIRLGGTGLNGSVYMNAVATTTAQIFLQRTIWNVNSQSSQETFVNNNTNSFITTTTTTAPTGSVDTSSAQTLYINATLANSGETIQLESYMVELFDRT